MFDATSTSGEAGIDPGACAGQSERYAVPESLRQQPADGGLERGLSEIQQRLGDITDEWSAAEGLQLALQGFGDRPGQDAPVAQVILGY